MKTSRLRVQQTLLIVLLVVAGMMAMSPVSDATIPLGRPDSDVRHHVAGTCTTPRRDYRVTLSIITPRAGASINLQSTPVFSVTGDVRGHNAAAVTAIELIADGTLVGTAHLNPARSHDNDGRNWNLQTSAPGGKHTLTACAMTAYGPVAATSVTITVVQPSPTATVLAPNVLTLPAATVSSITGTSATSVTFAKVPAINIGQVILAGATPTTPSGLMRRVTAIKRVGKGAVATTESASLTDVFWQVEIDKSDLPTTPAPATATAPAGLRRSAQVAQVAPAAAVQLPSRKFEFAVKAQRVDVLR